MGQQIWYGQVSSADEVQQILDLQATNHYSAVSDLVAASQGFVTVRHDPEVLQRMNQAYPSIIARVDGRVVGYCLVMLREFAAEVPVLAPMFAMLEGLSWEGQALECWRWFVMGQICVAEAYRGQGVFDGMYQALREVCRGDFDLVITEIARRNGRSINAHRRVGFTTMHTYPDDTTGEVWDVVALDFRNHSSSSK